LLPYLGGGELPRSLGYACECIPRLSAGFRALTNSQLPRMDDGGPVVKRRHVRPGWCSKLVDTSNGPSSLLDNRSVSLHSFILGSSNLGPEKDSGYSVWMGCGWDLVETKQGIHVERN
jgi:hypothetical protein